MKRFVVLGLIMAAALSVVFPVLSAEITITQNQAIDFKRIISGPGQSCTMNAVTGSLSGGACYDTFGSKGVILINGDPSRMVELEVIPGVSSNNLTFIPRFEGGTPVQAVSLNHVGAQLVNIGGTLSTDPVSEPDTGAVTLTYTLRVNYQ
nr:hypothetical protein [uncultured Desulfobacter sp.]